MRGDLDRLRRLPALEGSGHAETQRGALVSFVAGDHDHTRPLDGFGERHVAVVNPRRVGHARDGEEQGADERRGT